MAWIVLGLVTTLTLACVPLLVAFAAIRTISMTISMCIGGIAQWINSLIVATAFILWYGLTGQWSLVVEYAIEIARLLGLF